MKSFTVEKDCMLQEFTDEHYPQAGFIYHRVLRRKDIRVNGVHMTGDVLLRAGDVVSYYLSEKEDAQPTHEIVYEDENVLVADKLSGVNTDGLFNALKEGRKYLAEVHRLDRNTEGLIIFAKSSEAKKELLLAFREHKIDKTYLAVCKDNFKADSATLKAYLMKYPTRSEVDVFGTPRPGALEIITEYHILKRDGELALVEVILHTGRTHQIRAHMAFIGCPVLGDGKYGDKQLNKKYGFKRQRLVSYKMRIRCGGILEYLAEKYFVSGLAEKFCSNV